MFNYKSSFLFLFIQRLQSTDAWKLKFCCISGLSLYFYVECQIYLIYILMFFNHHADDISSGETSKFKIYLNSFVCV